MSNRFLKYFLLLTFGGLVHSQLKLKEGDTCYTKHDNLRGVCQLVRHCPRVKEEYDYGITPTFCGIKKNKPIVCCPKRISEQKCEEYTKLTVDEVFFNNFGRLMRGAEVNSKCVSMKPLIVGGNKTENGEFPHMAAIGCRSRRGRQISFICGGSLISERFVLTAAHCRFANGKSASFVRLGDQNLLNREDGMLERDIDIEKFIPHEKFRFTSYYYDIALIKLVENVEFTEFIRPACLWQLKNISIPKLIATGWGHTRTGGQTSDELMKVQLNSISTKTCNSHLKMKKLKDGIDDSQLCAGMLTGGKDICEGDSGGPIQVTKTNFCLYHVVGVTSAGGRKCGKANSPGIFTRVSHYLDWIEEKVWGKNDRSLAFV